MASGARAERDRVEAVITACVERLGYQEIKEGGTCSLSVPTFARR